MTFHVGQRVVCVDGNEHPNYIGRYMVLPVRGKVYTVRSIEPRWRWPKSEEGVGIRVQEIFRPDGDVPWVSTRFRPLDEKRIEVFRQMLVTPPREPVSA